ncbi:hypothetical protein DFH06DRAFT_904702, partial [Mycena polygramma]
SKANFTLALPLVTGGSWKKSPVTMSYKTLIYTVLMLPIRDSLSNRSPSSIDT